MTHYTVKSCCFIIDLRFATFAVAVFSVLGNIGVLAYKSWQMNMYRKELIYDDSVLNAILSMQALLLLISIVCILMDVLLFFGALLHRRKFLKCWLWGCAITSVESFTEIWHISMNFFMKDNVLAGSLILVANFLDAVVTVYLWIVVRSYYLELQQNINFPESRQNGPDVEAHPVVLSYSQDQEE